jgi:hypothetical protein
MDWHPRGSDKGRMIDAVLVKIDPVGVWIKMPAGVTDEKNAMAIKAVAAFNYSVSVVIESINTNFLFPLPALRPKTCMYCRLTLCPLPLSLGCLINDHAMCHAYNKRTNVLRRRYHGTHATDEATGLEAWRLFRKHTMQVNF